MVFFTGGQESRDQEKQDTESDFVLHHGLKKRKPRCL
jgi:hypothetical protein